MLEKSKKQIPIIQPYLPPQKEFMAVAEKVWETRQLTNGGPLVQELQKLLKERLKVERLKVYANGHLALDSAFRAMKLNQGEAITTPLTFLSTTHAIVMNGLEPVFCDVKESDGAMDEEKIEALITPRTRAIVPVHVYGFPCNCKRIQEIADKYHLKVIYDAAHAFGVTIDGKGIGSFGDAAMFSFHATKVYHSMEGGAVAYHEPALDQPLQSAKNFGLIDKEQADTISFNAKMSEMHAAMGIANLKYIDGQIARRQELVEHYLERLSRMEGIQLFHWNRPGVTYNYAYFPVCFDSEILGITRDTIAERLEQEYHVLARKYFFPLVSDLHCYRDQGESTLTPIAKKIAGQVLTLPLFAGLSHEQVNYICDALIEIIETKMS